MGNNRRAGKLQSSDPWTRVRRWCSQCTGHREKQEPLAMWIYVKQKTPVPQGARSKLGGALRTCRCCLGWKGSTSHMGLGESWQFSCRGTCNHEDPEPGRSVWGEEGSLSLGTQAAEKPYLAVCMPIKCHCPASVRGSSRLSSPL